MGSKLSFPAVSFPRERVVVVTGGNTGIGYETAKEIAMMGASVIIACRSQERALEAISRMNEEFANEKAKERANIIGDDQLPVEFMKLDLGSLKSTVEFIEAFKASGRRLHCLICNAGVAMSPQEHTVDGYEKMFQTNYLGHFLIVAHFLPIMKISGDDCRIIFVSSLAHHWAEFNMETAQAKDARKYNRYAYYGNSKIYQIMHMYSMARRLQGQNITVTSLHPGLVNTEVIRNFSNSAFGFFFRGATACGMTKSPSQGAATTINCAVNPKLANVSEVFYVDTKPATPTRVARNKKYQEDLWKYTLKCLEEYISEDVLNCLEGKD